MNHIIEHIVKEYQHNQETLAGVCRFAFEVYIAYLLERAMEHFYDVLGRFLSKAREKVSERWEVLTEEVIPNVQAAIKRVSAKLLHAVRR